MKISIIGSGRVGSTVAFVLLLHKLADELVLLDIDEDTARGEALDLRHSLAATGKPVEITGTTDYKDTEGSDLIVITAGAARNPGESRLDLRDKNVAILKDVVGKIKKYNDEPFIFIISNPVDILTYYALKMTGYPERKVFGLGTALDTIRLRSLLMAKYGPEIDSEEVYVFGEHGDSMFPVFSRLKGDYDNKELDRLFENVRDGGIQVIELKGATWFAPALAVCEIVQGLIMDKEKVIPLSIYSKEEDICIGYPARINKSGVEPIDCEISNEEKKALQRSIETIREHLKG